MNELYYIVLKLIMAEDKINLNLIQINQLLYEEEPPKFAIPLYFHAIRIALERAQEEPIHPRTFKKLRNSFNNFKRNHAESFKQYDQVHIFMLEQSNKMISSETYNSKAIMRHPIFQPFQTISDQNSESTIILEQEIYFFESQPTILENESSEQLIRTSNRNDVFSPDISPSSMKNDQQMNDIWQRVEKYYKEHRLDEAYNQYTNFKKISIRQRPNCQTCTDKLDTVNKIEQQYKLMTHYYQFFDEPGFIFDKQDKGVRLYYKIYEQSNQISVRVQAQLDISIDVFLCIVSQIDLFEKYIPFSYETKQIQRLSRNQKIGTSKVYLPLLSDRQAYFFAAAYDRLQTHNSIFFFSKTISSDYEFQKKINFKIPKNEDFIELQYKFYILEYQPTGFEKGKIRLSTNIDLKLSFLPNFVINKTCRIFSFDYFKNLIKVSKNFAGSQWEQKMKQNKQIYDFFKQRIKQYLKSKQK